MTEETTRLIDTLKILGYTPTSYSGRGMYGKECVSVSTDDAHGDDLRDELAKRNFDDPRPNMEQRGRRYVGQQYTCLTKWGRPGPWNFWALFWASLDLLQQVCSAGLVS